MTRVVRILLSLERLLLAGIMLTMVALYTLAILTRELAPSYASDVAWIDEATRILLVWMVFLGLGLALQSGRHVAMSTLFDAMPGRTRRLLGKLIDLVGIGFALYLAWLGFGMTRFVAGAGQISPTLGISMAWLYAVLPLGFVLLALRYVLDLAGVIDFRARRDDSPAAEA